MKGHEALAHTLSRAGVGVVFSLPGRGNLLIDHSLHHNTAVQYVQVLREDAAVMAAEAFSRITGTIGVCSVTQGPGLTNTVTALTTAVRYETPMLVIVGAPYDVTPPHIQTIDHEDVIRCTGATFRRIRSVETLEHDLHLAMRESLVQSGPVVLEVSLEVQESETSLTDETFLPSSSQAQAIPESAAVDHAAAIVANSKRPVVLAGLGAVKSGAEESLVELAGCIGAATGSTLRAMDFFRDDPFNLGLVGTLGTDLSASTLAESDCLLAFGASLNTYTTSGGSLLRGKSIVQCDLNSSSIGKDVTPTCSLVGDADLTARAILKHVKGGARQATGLRTVELRDALASRRDEEFIDESDDDTVDMRTFLRWLDSVVAPNKTVVFDSGRFVLAPIRFLHVEDPACFVPTMSFGSIGLSVGAAIGAAFARPSRTVLQIMGDGSFMMCLGEIATFVRYGLNVVMVVLNDNCYSAEFHTLRQAGLDTSISEFEWPALAGIAESMGCPAVAVNSLKDLDRVDNIIRNRRGPCLIEVKVNPSVSIGFHDQ